MHETYRLWTHQHHQLAWCSLSIILDLRSKMVSPFKFSSPRVGIDVYIAGEVKSQVSTCQILPKVQRSWRWVQTSCQKSPGHLLGWKTKMESIRTTYQEFQIENLMVFSMVDLTCKSWTPKMVDIQYQKSYFSPCGTEKNCFSSALWRPSGVSFERNAPLTHQVICKKSSIPFTKLIWVKGMLLFLQMTWCVRWRWKVCLLTDDVDVFSMER